MRSASLSLRRYDKTARCGCGRSEVAGPAGAQGSGAVLACGSRVFAVESGEDGTGGGRIVGENRGLAR